MLGRPRQGAVQGGLVEDDEVTRLARHVIDDLLVLLPAPDLLGHREIRLVTSGHHTHAAIALVDMGELELADDHAAAHLAVAIDVVLGVGEVTGGGPVDDEALRALAAGEHEGGVIHLPAPTEEGVQVGDQFGVGQQIAEGLAVRRLPREHAGEDAASLRTVRVAVGVVVGVLAPLVPVGVEGFVEGEDLVRGEETLDLQKTLQVKKKLLSVVHIVTYSQLQFMYAPNPPNSPQDRLSLGGWIWRKEMAMQTSSPGSYSSWASPWRSTRKSSVSSWVRAAWTGASPA